ncbi:Kunitz/Bovine pancreatic trypsin inhibitor domain protein [Oesophagostomum dentatum]|uniref:Kunitz/Bovine pancreatic trypsin inhibitor domain protein n=1 Tax=Oesophagostomum dentatum TaxID=61180 RepID=A0A0B1TJ91_OESDE|nr:Kunitz/Bovine pancreatic trypsin inhibitor domain protein [Oesophagostomum dentatum]
MEFGNGFQYIRRYAFVKRFGTCVQFLWSGKMENSNNFETWDDCARACGAPSTPRPQDVCQMDMDRGECHRSAQR